VTKLLTLRDAITGQIESNRSALGHEGHFAGHRTRLTAEIRARAPAGGRGRLCLLGAGNANDVDLEAVAGDFAEVHLVDVDAQAVERARARVAPARRGRIILHAPVDVMGVSERLDAWSRSPPSMDAIAGESVGGLERVARSLSGPFDIVVSCCLLTQLQLVLLEVVGDGHPRFAELRSIVSAIHVRLLAALLAPGGVGLLVTDLTGSDTYPFGHLPPDADLGRLMGELLAAGNIIGAAHPGGLSAVIRRDPALSAAYETRFPIGPWLWQNGPDSIYLVYGLEIAARPVGVPPGAERT
jgi:hypothetical protein